MSSAAEKTLKAFIAPVRAPAKPRLKATVRELGRLIDEAPEGLCVAIEASGLMNAWRTQLGTLVQTSQKIGGALGIVDLVRKASGR